MRTVVKEGEDELEWVGKINRSGRLYYIKVPNVYGKEYHRSTVRIKIIFLIKKRKSGV